MSLRLPSMTRSRSRSTLRQPSRDRQPNKLLKSHPSSRGTSPTSRIGRRASRLDLYREKSSRRNSCVNLAQEIEHLPTGINAREIKRWDGFQRMTARWDSLRKDSELWLHSGDCVVHFYEKGSSRRGASLRVSLADIESSNCRPFLDRYPLDLIDPAREPNIELDRASRFSRYYEDTFPQYEMFIPAPSEFSKDEALQYHITTRNFFAWMYNRPLVGDRLGKAMIRLQERMEQYRPDQQENRDNVFAYLEDQGYLDFRHCPDHALALLQYAEHYQSRDLWIDAFAHCTGMNDELDASCEFESVSRASQALITRAHIEMDIRLERAGKSLEDFLESDVPGADLELGKQAQIHLERFRSFLQCHYIGRYGYWPPNLNKKSSDALPKPVYQSMYYDLRNLYEYLADKNSSIDLPTGQFIDNGINTYKNLRIFDTKNKYTHLPHPLGLLPDVPEPLHRRRSIWNIFGYNQAKKERRLAAFTSLKSATNHDDHRVMSSNIVREYLRFERDWTMIEDPSVSCIEARKVRWILVYAMLQVLISVAKVPEEVRDTDGVSYPLCCQTAGTPPWSTTKTETEKPMQPSEPAISMSDIVDPIGDLTDLKPSPLRVSSSHGTPSSPQRTTLPSTLPLRAPKPMRSSSIDFLNQSAGSNLLTPSEVPIMDRSRPWSLRTPSMSTLTTLAPTQSQEPPPNMPSPTDQGQISDPSTPSSSEMDGSGGWSASSSEDGMDHHSVAESNSNDGDDEDDEPQSKGLKVPHHRWVKKAPSAESMTRCNPEVEQFLTS